MKKKIVIGIALYSLKIFALGGGNIMTSPTTSSLGNPVQQAEVSADSVFYNPAALGFLEEGQHVGIGMYICKPDYKQGVTGPFGNAADINVDNLQYIPAGEYIYMKGDRAYYIGVGSMGQGGFLDVTTNNPAIKNAKLDYIAPGIVFGVAQKLNEKVSVSLGMRYTYLYQKLEFDGRQSRDLEVKGDGIAPEIGIYYRATPKWDLSAKYLFRTKIDQDVSSDYSRVNDQVPNRNDYPAVLTTGTSYALNEKNKVYLGYNIIFEDADYVYSGGHNGMENYDNTKEYMIGYKRVVNEKIDINLGYTYVDRCTNGDPKTIKELDASVYGLSLIYHQNENTYYTAAISTNHYDSYNSSSVGSKRKENVMGLSVNTKL